jgi:hypothetical protein
MAVIFKFRPFIPRNESLATGMDALKMKKKVLALAGI